MRVVVIIVDDISRQIVDDEFVEKNGKQHTQTHIELIDPSIDGSIDEIEILVVDYYLIFFFSDFEKIYKKKIGKKNLTNKPETKKRKEKNQ